jgi:hypothetical protein
MQTAEAFGFRVAGLGFRLEGFGFRVSGSGFFTLARDTTPGHSLAFRV